MRQDATSRLSRAVSRPLRLSLAGKLAHRVSERCSLWELVGLCKAYRAVDVTLSATRSVLSVHAFKNTALAVRDILDSFPFREVSLKDARCVIGQIRNLVADRDLFDNHSSLRRFQRFCSFTAMSTHIDY